LCSRLYEREGSVLETLCHMLTMVHCIRPACLIIRVWWLPILRHQAEDTHIDLGVASIAPLLVVGNATAMHSIAASILGALWAHINKQIPQAQGRQNASDRRRGLQNMDNVGQCKEIGSNETLKRTCQGQLTAGYDRSIGYELALGALGEGLYP
jgi:hypothetical protein